MQMNAAKLCASTKKFIFHHEYHNANIYSVLHRMVPLCRVCQTNRMNSELFARRHNVINHIFDLWMTLLMRCNKRHGRLNFFGKRKDAQRKHFEVTFQH